MAGPQRAGAATPELGAVTGAELGIARVRARAGAEGGSGEETSGGSGPGSPEVLGSAEMEGVGCLASRSPILEADSDKSGPVSSYLIGSSVTGS